VYPKYFGLKEASFSITPDPHYLYLSAQHREALAHLLYGAGDAGGFVLLTGEVGTGKTTICRAFLEQLPDDVDVALVLNPAMTAVELMHAVCDEFGIDVDDGEQSAKALVDRLNRFLLDLHARGRRPVLIIDEAQNLRPKVLEQIRLLTNLETTKHKLLQIFLIGQPELRTMLASRDLRQLNQRITARFHLKPLTARETAAYIDHRVAVAGVDRPLFTAAALRRVHRCSAGVPRLINLLCDRSLLGAAVSRRNQVTPAIVARAAREVRGSDADGGVLPRRRFALAVPLSVTAALLVGLWAGSTGILGRVPDALLAWTGGSSGPASESEVPDAPQAEQADAVAMLPEAPTPPPRRTDPVVEPGPEPDTIDAAAIPDRAAAAEPEPMPEPEPEPEPEPMLEPEPMPVVAAADESTLQPALASAEPVPEPDEAPGPLAPAAPAESEPDPDPPVSRISMARLVPTLDDPDPQRLSELLVPSGGTVDELLRLWGIATDHLVTGLDCPAASAFGLGCEKGNGRWSDLRQFDRPAALKLTLPDGTVGEAVIAELDEEHAMLVRGEKALRVPVAVLDERWSGDYLLLWRMPPENARIIGRGSGSVPVAWLRQRIASLPSAGIEPEPARYDGQLIDAIKALQSDHGLAVDGIAGPHTLIVLANETGAADAPRLAPLR
jgi:general secretion pathway protein A